MAERPAFEAKDLNLRLALSAMGGLLLLGTAAAFLVGPLFGYRRMEHLLVDSATQPLHDPFAVERRFPKPLLQNNPTLDWETFSRDQRRILSTYAWENADHGLARVPIERAMDLLLAQGIPARREGQ